MAISKSIAALLLAWATTTVFLAAQPRSAPRPHSATAEERADDDLKDAENLLQKQQYTQAEEKLLALVVKQDKNPQAWFDLGFAQGRLGKTADSITAYRKAAELSPKWFEAQQNLGLALAKAGDFPSAAAALKVAVTLKPTTGGPKALSQAWLSLAEVTEASEPQEALAGYQKAVELDPANAEALLRAAKLAERYGNSSAAEQQYLKLADAGNSEAVEGLITVYLQQKRYSDAETWLRKYMSANPGNITAQIQLGKLLAAQGKTQDAIAALEPAYNATRDPGLARELAALYLEAKQYDSASKLLQPLVAHNPNDPQLHLDYGSALAHQHKYPEAQTELLKAVQLKPSLSEAYFDLAYVAQQNKNHELAIRVLDARAKLQPETPATYFLRATAYDSLRMYKPAAENYKLFLGVAAGKFPDQEFQARHRLKAIEPN
jgi:tetratricopeptide (TPR) repeat protein